MGDIGLISVAQAHDLFDSTDLAVMDIASRAVLAFKHLGMSKPFLLGVIAETYAAGRLRGRKDSAMQRLLRADTKPSGEEE